MPRSYYGHLYSGHATRTARGGIRAKSMRGSFGSNWWAHRWLEVLESFDISSRLSRGRSYARQGQVLSIEIDSGEVRAQVQGSRTTPYKVTIRFKQLCEKIWTDLCQSAMQQPIIAAKLLASELPPELEKLLERSNVSLFPQRSEDLRTDCSCPDWSNPCKHIAAVYYLLAEEFDQDPFLLFLLRGMSKKAFLEEIARIADDHSLPTLGSSGEGSAPVEYGGHAPAEPEIIGKDNSEHEKPLQLVATKFWNEYATEEKRTPSGESKPPKINAALPKSLGNLPFWRGDEELTKFLELVYKTASENTLHLMAESGGSAED